MWNTKLDCFISCDSTFEQAGVVLFGAPFDASASFRPGARFAPGAIRRDSYGLETWSPYQKKDLESFFVFDGGDLELPFGNPQKTLAFVETAVASVLADGKKPFMLGGDHLITLGAIRAAVSKAPDLRVLQLDAHADLRDDYLGEKLSHATVMHRVWELVGDGRITQIGIRSGDAQEFAFMERHTVECSPTPDAMLDLSKRWAGKPVYLTLDIDVLDPSVAPGTGTPEPGGLSFSTLLNALLSTSNMNIIGCDLVELSPPYDPSGITTAAACKLVREMLMIVGGQTAWEKRLS